MAIAKRVVFEGRVQGVGFRFTARELARDFAVCGFVRNLADGTVELIAEGEPEEVSAFLAAVIGRMSNYIERRCVTDEPIQNFQDFNIR
jgi:acylphosphatase